MNTCQFNSIIFNSLILIAIYPLVHSSTSCSIFLSLNCSCFQSNFDLDLSLKIKSYSHLYCQGDSINKRTFQPPFGSDFKNQNRFRTISIEFVLKDQVVIYSNQFDSLSLLFLQTNNDANIELSIRFIGFTHIIFNKYSITSNMFQTKHYKKRLSLHFVPTISNYSQVN